ncbi:hypothetical protein K432DRAFT_473432 [Lepidopterella palustris CBS 459.81]|uniref:Uncharacterized protein n=1 Tax=Lepidopterella palustris CBS 459.81 TaxID=1314670 RepID=A0A8E2EE60_9PEZI|nr:hypothetical protein K432DRAFT_473432 [Lepidopterella palustris CBS 459.81]
MSLWGELDRYPWLDAQPLAGSQLSTNGSFDSLSLSIAANSDRYILARLAWSQILPKYVSNCMQRAQSASGQSVEAIRTGNMYRLPVAAEILKEGVSDDTRACVSGRLPWDKCLSAFFHHSFSTLQELSGAVRDGLRSATKHTGVAATKGEAHFTIPNPNFRLAIENLTIFRSERAHSGRHAVNSRRRAYNSNFLRLFRWI